MPIMSMPSPAPRTSLTFITIGVVMAIPSAVWYAMFDPQGVARFLCASLFFLGLAFLIIGFSVGYIGRAARQAELPPTEVIGTVARQEAAMANWAMTPASSPMPAAPASNPAGGATTFLQTGQPAAQAH